MKYCNKSPLESPNDVTLKLRELEEAMLGPELDKPDTHFDETIHLPTTGNLKQVLISCARALSARDFTMADWLIDELRRMVSVSGEPVQRLGAYLLEGLIARQASSGTSIYKALDRKEKATLDVFSYLHILYEVCPYIKFGYMSANGAIAEAMKDEDRVHIVDFQIGQGTQWVSLIQAFAARPGGPPHIRITGVSGVDFVGKRLSDLARLYNVPFEYHFSDSAFACEVEPSHLGVREGEALAVNFAFSLHHTPCESLCTKNHRDRVIRMVRKISPKVVTLVEFELNTNTAPFLPRFVDTLEFYGAMFESIDVTLPRNFKERIDVEQHCLARELVNIIACEGEERIERYELQVKWNSRFEMAGFQPFPLSSFVNSTIRTLLSRYSKEYSLHEKDGVLYLGWLNRNLVASSAWK